MNLTSLFSSKKESSGIFVPAENGFRELTDGPAAPSVNEMAKYFGYEPDQVHFYLGRAWTPESTIQAVIFEIFTDKVVYVATHKSVTHLTPSMLNTFLRGFNALEEFDDVTANEILATGIENKSLTVKFLSRVLGLTDTEPNGIFYSSRLGLYLFFNAGLLTDFQPADGLTYWAKHWKQLNPGMVSDYEQVARKYWGGNFSKVINEINIQSDALFDTPNCVKNAFVPLHRGEQGTVNYKMLLVYHYDHPLTLEEFMEVNHGRYKLLPAGGPRWFQLGRFSYKFSEQGELIHKSQLN
jgi:hypothetical protein